MAEERNQFVDIMRGIAMLLVVLGHTMTGCTTGAEESILFNIVAGNFMSAITLCVVVINLILQSNMLKSYWE